MNINADLLKLAKELNVEHISQIFSYDFRIKVSERKKKRFRSFYQYQTQTMFDINKNLTDKNK